MKIYAKAKLDRLSSESRHELAQKSGVTRRRKKAISQRVKHYNDVTDHNLHDW